MNSKRGQSSGMTSFKAESGTATIITEVSQSAEEWHISLVAITGNRAEKSISKHLEKKEIWC